MDTGMLLPQKPALQSELIPALCLPFLPSCPASGGSVHMWD